jgi:hypothetical protein
MAPVGLKESQVVEISKNLDIILFITNWVFHHLLRIIKSEFDWELLNVVPEFMREMHRGCLPDYILKFLEGCRQVSPNFIKLIKSEVEL